MTTEHDFDENMVGIISSIEKIVGPNKFVGSVKLNASASSWSPAPLNPEDEHTPKPMNNVTNLLESVLPAGASIQEKTRTKPRTRKSKSKK